MMNAGAALRICYGYGSASARLGGRCDDLGVTIFNECNTRRLPPISCYYRSPMRRSRAFGNSFSTQSMTVRSVPVQVALDLLNAGHHYLDVRTPEEYAAGHVEGAVNIPFMFKAAGGLTNNTNFVAEVSSKFNKDDEIVVGCQSGKRSMMAATQLISSQFANVTDMGGGYAAWLQSNLPITKSI